MAKSRSRRGGYGWGGRKRTRGGALLPSFNGAIGTNGADWGTANVAAGANGRSSAGDVPLPNYTGNYAAAGGRRKKSRKVTAKAIKRVLKKAGLKTSGSKRTLTKRARKARLMGGGLVAGNPYGSYTGTGSAGLADQATGVQPGDAAVKSV